MLRKACKNNLCISWDALISNDDLLLGLTSATTLNRLLFILEWLSTLTYIFCVTCVLIYHLATRDARITLLIGTLNFARAPEQAPLGFWVGFWVFRSQANIRQHIIDSSRTALARIYACDRLYKIFTRWLSGNYPNELVRVPAASGQPRRSQYPRALSMPTETWPLRCQPSSMDS